MDNKIKQFIKENIHETVRFLPEDEGELIGLPYRYTVPVASGMFQEIYYWDTYFTNIGLLEIGEIELAKNNIENMFYMIERFGFIPNGSRTFYLNRSQPPYLSLMVRDLFAVTKDKEWLKRAYEVLKKEYDFWQTNRKMQGGLNGYTNYKVITKTQEEYDAQINQFINRTGYKPENMTDEVKSELYQGFCSVCEMGWDCNSRVLADGHNYLSLDLNSLLYELEKNMAEFACILEIGEQEIWEDRMNARKMNMQVLWDKSRGVFVDYNIKTNEFSAYLAAACFYPMFIGLATNEQAESIKNVMLKKIELKYGLSSGEPNSPWECQWDYPNVWPPMQLIIFRALCNYGYFDDAYRIAEKYTTLIETNFEKTGNLWEKYDGNTGEVTSFEYDAPAMMGWTAGVYLYFIRMLEERK